MMDCKVISILKEMREDERRVIGINEDLNSNYSHGEKDEALNVAIFALENRNKFYISKDRIEDYIETLNEKLKEYGVEFGNNKILYTKSLLKEEDVKTVGSMLIQRETLKELLGE